MKIRGLHVFALAVPALVVLVAVLESIGWPFLAGPVQRFLSDFLQRRVEFVDSGTDGERRLRVRFFGSLRIDTARLEIGAPEWSAEPYMVRADGVHLRLRYGDLWADRQGAPLSVAHLEARVLDAVLERRDPQHASWQFGRPKIEPAMTPALPTFDRLLVSEGRIRYADVPLDLVAEGTATLREGTAPAGTTDRLAQGLHATATGRRAGVDFELRLDTESVLPWIDTTGRSPPVDVRIAARSGRTRASFDGTARDALHLEALSGRFEVAGPSLSKLGDALGLTLPTTDRFGLAGRLRKQATLWSVVVERARVGQSSLVGEFQYDTARARPLLAGRLGGEVLRFADLAPTVGAPPPSAPPVRRTRAIPDREFDIPSLRAMDATILVDIARIDLGEAFREPLQPLQGHLRLNEGVLSIDELVANTSRGRVRGDIALDSRPATPEWRARLRWRDIALERWIRQERSGGKPPYIAGRLAGRVDVAGRGRSAAEMVSTLEGEAVMRLRAARISHLAVEVAGIDVAESLGLLFRGDHPLPVHCAVGHWIVRRGVGQSRVLVIDTPDSTIWIDGTVSLAKERLDLRATVAPKDLSPMALRTPLKIQGSFLSPDVSLEKGPLVRRLALAGLLGALQPLAAAIAGIDPGAGSDTAGDPERGCEQLIRMARAPPVPARAADPRPGPRTLR